MRRIGVVGGGLMGAGIAEVGARAGLDVILVESTTQAATSARSRIDTSLQGAEAKGKLGQGETAHQVLDRICRGHGSRRPGGS